jgi:hypothetical protein
VAQGTPIYVVLTSALRLMNDLEIEKCWWHVVLTRPNLHNISLKLRFATIVADAPHLACRLSDLKKGEINHVHKLCSILCTYKILSKKTLPKCINDV